MDKRQQLRSSQRAARQRRRRKRLRTIRITLIALVSVIAALLAVLVLLHRMQDRQSASQTDPAGNAALSGDQQAVPAEPRRLSLTEKQLHSGDLILVNAAHPYDFEANADTADRVSIRENQTVIYPVEKEEFQLERRALAKLDQLVEACTQAIGYRDTSIASAWRSLEYQQKLWDEMGEEYGEDYVRKYVSVPGCSEHHTGLAVDFGIVNSDGSIGTFSTSNNAKWMDEHAWEYGFVRRFAEDKVEVTGISNESWHFRYVSIPHAKYMKEENLALEEYIDFLRADTSPEKPLVIEEGDQTWRIFFTAEREITEPSGAYRVSGNNVDGFIITMVG